MADFAGTIRNMLKEVYTVPDLERWSETVADIVPSPRLSVFGDPVAQSRSPQMHNAALEQCGIDARYCRLLVHPEELPRAMRLLVENAFIGTNVTIPHKAAALELMDELDETARKMGAVNTVLVQGERLLGFNTDGPGLSRAVRSEFGVDLRDLRVLILGAGGGAGRAIAVQCALEGCERLVLVNRTLEKAQALAGELAPYFRQARVLGPVARLSAVPLEAERLRFELEHTDLLINTTPLGMKPTDRSPLPANLLLPHLMVYDTVYSVRRTPLLAAAEEAGARGANGLSMLLHQGALSFETWFNRPAPLEVMRAALEAS